MTTNDLYVRMCEKHPIQREWKPGIGQQTNTGIILRFQQGTFIRDLKNDVKPLPDTLVYYQQVDGCMISECHTWKYIREEMFWLPRQEDWQEKYQEATTGRTGSPKCFSNWWVDNAKYAHKALPADDKDFKLSYFWTILWCLFVSKEVYGLEWDWEKNMWRKKNEQT